MLIYEYLEKHAMEQPDHPFIKLENETYSFYEVYKMVKHLAYVFKNNYGIKKGTHVSVILPNEIDFILIFFAIAKVGAVIVPMNPQYKSDMLKYMINQSESSIVIYHKDVDLILENHTKKIKIGDKGILHLIENISEEFNDKIDHLDSNEKVREQDIFSIIYTSGTTSKPKGVVNTQKTYLLAGLDIVDALQISKKDITYLFLPLFHANPQMYGIMSALVKGNTLLIGRKFSASEFWMKASKKQFSIFTYVGTVLTILAKTSPPNVSFHESIRGVGGGAPKEVWQKLMKLGIKIHELYGMTETGGFVTINTTQNWKYGTVGKVRRNVEVTVLNDYDEECKNNEKGEIAVRPNKPFVMFNEYYNDPEKTLDVVRNLWFHTGDIGWFDSEGYLHFEGRKKEIIRKKGENISPTFIEEVYLRLLEVNEAACVGVADELVGEEIKLCLVSSIALN